MYADLSCGPVNYYRPSAPKQDATNFSPGELERGRLSRPPYAPYVAADSLWHSNHGSPRANLTRQPSANISPALLGT